MKRVVAAGGLFLVASLAVCDERPGTAAGASREEDRMTTIRIGETTVWHGDDHSIGVAYIIEGTYRDAAGQERHGPLASLVIVKAGTRDGAGETHVKAWAGSEFRMGDRVCKVSKVVVGGGGEGGYVEVEIPR